MDKLNTAKSLAILVKGFIAMIIQIIIIRELLVIFSGNELSLGIILANWLLLEALGSGLLAKAFSNLKDNLKPYLILQILIILSLPLTVWLARTTKANLGIFYGEAVNLYQMFLISFTTLFLFSVLDGLQFFFACRLLSDNKTKEQAVSFAYVIEALGMLLGGIIFTYVFLTWLNSFQIAFLLVIVAIISTSFLCLVSGMNNKKIIEGFLISLLILSSGLFLTGQVNSLQSLSVKKQFPQQKILDYKNSVYGNITVTQRQGQFTFFSNGLPAVVTPITDIAFAEEFVHLTLLYHPAPHDLLLISAGAGGILNEILKEPVSSVDYAELDPLIIDEIKKFPTEITKKELGNPRVNIIYQDGRGLVKNSTKKFDTILINISSPTTLQINRLFTREFYQETKKILKPDGLISVRLPGSLTYLNEELCQLNNSIYKTLSSIYKNVLVIPGDFNLFLASNSLDLQKLTIQTIISRFKHRNLKTYFVTEFSLNYRLNNSWRDWFFSRLREAEKTKFLNEDFSPRGLFFGISFVYSLISPQTRNVFMFMGKIKLSSVIVVISLIFLIFIYFLQSERQNNIQIGKSLKCMILISGFCAIALELILILGFQIIYGFIYSWVGILSGAFMFGLAFGGFLSAKRFEKLKNDSLTLLKLESALIAFSIILPLSLFSLSKIIQNVADLITKPTFFILSFLTGFLLGAEFTLANRIYFKNLKTGKDKFAQLYAYDLIGASAGAILTAVWLIPVLGIGETAILMAYLKLLAVVAFVFAIRKQAV